jgi:hypothetical protein
MTGIRVLKAMMQDGSLVELSAVVLPLLGAILLLFFYLTG